MSSWKESSGRVDGPDVYQFGDVTQTMLNSLKWQMKTEQKDSSENSEIKDVGYTNWGQRFVLPLPKSLTQSSWKKFSGRASGNEGYQFGDISRSIYSTLFYRSSAVVDDEIITESLQLNNKQVMIFMMQWSQHFWSCCYDNHVYAFVNINWCCIVFTGKRTDVNRAIEYMNQNFINRLKTENVVAADKLSFIILGNDDSRSQLVDILHPTLQVIVDSMDIGSENWFIINGFEKQVNECVRFINRCSVDLQKYLNDSDQFEIERNNYKRDVKQLCQQGKDIVSANRQPMKTEEELNLKKKHSALLKMKGTLIAKLKILESFEEDFIYENGLHCVHDNKAQEGNFPVYWKMVHRWSHSFRPSFHEITDDRKNCLANLILEFFESWKQENKLCQHAYAIYSPEKRQKGKKTREIIELIPLTQTSSLEEEPEQDQEHHQKHEQEKEDAIENGMKRKKKLSASHLMSDIVSRSENPKNSLEDNLQYEAHVGDTDEEDDKIEALQQVTLQYQLDEGTISQAISARNSEILDTIPTKEAKEDQEQVEQEEQKQEQEKGRNEHNLADQQTPAAQSSSPSFSHTVKTKKLISIQQIENARLWKMYDDVRFDLDDDECGITGRDKLIMGGNNQRKKQQWLEPENIDLGFELDLQMNEKLSFIHLSSDLVTSVASFGIDALPYHVPLSSVDNLAENENPIDEEEIQGEETRTFDYASPLSSFDIGKNNNSKGNIRKENSNCLIFDKEDTNDGDDDDNDALLMFLLCRGNTQAWYPVCILIFD